MLVPLLLLLLLLLGPGLAAGEETLITCLRAEPCVLPCKFNSDGKGVRVMWFKKKAVVSCTRYGNTSWVVGHNSPADKYKGRTDLYADKVLEGNATLVLRNVTPHDEGKYFCVTIMQPRTDESAVVSLQVRAPVEDVSAEVGHAAVWCRARGSNPAPTLTWHRPPPPTAAGCATGPSLIQALAGSNLNVPCSLPYALCAASPHLWFRGSQPILTINASGDRTRLSFWGEWSLHVYDSRAAARTLTLRNLSTAHQGAYTCEVSAADQTILTVSNVTIGEDLRLETLVPITVLASLLFLSYCAVAFLLVKIRRMEGQKSSIDSSLTSLSVSSGGSAGAPASDS
ncbi:butyrophilin subfamily 3 member A2-like [Synchiropus splendidus]|uniref:butyrophilin subfamily 3 member A2-like n=1 Tax=Synchiropus splendidus TaxID=270530 RepID=UPI00237E09C3|nr:butyrophilin subfamily 3 member A2-like [Synchiropus splendidus]